VTTQRPVEPQTAEDIGLPELVVAELARRGQTVAVAESLTGGLVTAALARVPGCSAVLRGGVVAYATDLKHSLLDVPGPELAHDGPVSSATALAMAAGVRRRLGATWGVATTGVAGPEPQAGYPPGTVHVAVVGPGISVTGQIDLPGDRPAVRAGAVDAALRLLAEHLGPGESAACDDG
jgi:nicotinamide-nucleotide amidase